jgi:hypothetical protein
VSDNAALRHTSRKQAQPQQQEQQKQKQQQQQEIRTRSALLSQPVAGEDHAWIGLLRMLACLQTLPLSEHIVGLVSEDHQIPRPNYSDCTHHLTSYQSTPSSFPRPRAPT